MASLFVIQGVDQGKRFELELGSTGLGRDSSNPIRLYDTEISRRHAELRLERGRALIVDLGSANGTFVNGAAIEQMELHPGDRLQLGQTVLVYEDERRPGRDHDLTARVAFTEADTDDRSAILGRIPAEEGSRVLHTPAATGGWLRDRLVNLSIMYRATQAISDILDPDALAARILDLVFESIGADRGAILLKGNDGSLTARAVKMGAAPLPDEKMSISRTIVDYVLKTREGVIITDAPSDARFGRAQSVVDFQIREAICVPVEGRHSTLGVLYADILSGAGALGKGGKFNQDQLMLMVAIGHQAGLALENTIFYHEKIEAERLAAIGQTIATLSHHIKNILQGVRGGSYLIDLGLKDKDESIVRRGWTIVDKNQTKIYNLVMDMLSFSKEREPALEAADLNETVGDVIELMQPRAAEMGVVLNWSPDSALPMVQIDPEGIHRAVLNIVTNAIDASEGADDARVDVSTHWDEDRKTAQIRIVDNGVGIDPADLGTIFQLFASTKGSRGTGLGLPVSQKIIREHGGQITVESEPGQGASFLIELPVSRPGEPGA